MNPPVSRDSGGFWFLAWNEKYNIHKQKDKLCISHFQCGYRAVIVECVGTWYYVADSSLKMEIRSHSRR